MSDGTAFDALDGHQDAADQQRDLQASATSSATPCSTLSGYHIRLPAPDQRFPHGAPRPQDIAARFGATVDALAFVKDEQGRARLPLPAAVAQHHRSSSRNASTGRSPTAPAASAIRAAKEVMKIYRYRESPEIRSRKTSRRGFVRGPRSYIDGLSRSDEMGNEELRPPRPGGHPVADQGVGVDPDAQFVLSAWARSLRCRVHSRLYRAPNSGRTTPRKHVLKVLKKYKRADPALETMAGVIQAGIDQRVLPRTDPARSAGPLSACVRTMLLKAGDAAVIARELADVRRSLRV